MIIFIRGIPGSGKTLISNTLGEKIGYDIIHVDDFKRELLNANPKAFFLEDAVPYSYKKTLEVLEKYKDKNIIVEEIFRNKNFIEEVVDFCNKNKVKYAWFNITRDIQKILETNENRTRKVKNTPETLDRMRQQIEDIHIKGEITVNNENLEESVQKIINSLEY